MSFGIAALLLAGISAGWLLLRVARSDSVAGTGDRNVTILKVVVLFGLVAALFAAKLWPLAFMVLVAAGGVMAIESWRDSNIAADTADAARQIPPQKAMTIDEAAAVLGVSADAQAPEIKAAHKKLITQIHPDKGGTDYLAAKINEARDLLLRRLGER